MNRVVLRDRLILLEKRFENMFSVLSDTHQQNKRREMIEIKKRYCDNLKKDCLFDDSTDSCEDGGNLGKVKGLVNGRSGNNFGST